MQYNSMRLIMFMLSVACASNIYAATKTGPPLSPRGAQALPARNLHFQLNRLKSLLNKLKDKLANLQEKLGTLKEKMTHAPLKERIVPQAAEKPVSLLEQIKAGKTLKKVAVKKATGEPAKDILATQMETAIHKRRLGLAEEDTDEDAGDWSDTEQEAKLRAEEEEAKKKVAKQPTAKPEAPAAEEKTTEAAPEKPEVHVAPKPDIKPQQPPRDIQTALASGALEKSFIKQSADLIEIAKALNDWKTFGDPLPNVVITNQDKINNAMINLKNEQNRLKELAQNRLGLKVGPNKPTVKEKEALAKIANFNPSAI